MTDRRPLLRAIYDAAVAAAHPDVVLASHLRPVPKGKVICLAAGKGAAAMAAAAERHYLDALEMEPSRLTGIATTRHGHGVPTRRIKVIEAGHPVPDEAGLKGAEDSLKLARRRDRTICCWCCCPAAAPPTGSRPSTASPSRRSSR